MEQTLAFLDRQIIDAGVPVRHQAILVKLPILVAIGAEPVSISMVVFLRVSNRDAVIREGPEFLDQSVVQFLGPFVR